MFTFLPCKCFLVNSWVAEEIGVKLSINIEIIFGMIFNVAPISTPSCKIPETSKPASRPIPTPTIKPITNGSPKTPNRF